MIKFTHKLIVGEVDMKCIHLDFHTGPDIPEVGQLFDKAEFTKTLKDAKIDRITLFAKCHHGYTYYPSKFAQMHPNLKFNLLKEQLEAAHAAGAKAPIYITVGWSKKDADEHPDWLHIDFDTKKPVCMGMPISDDLDAPIGDNSWVTLCPNGPYLEHLKDLTHEVCQEFAPVDGLFYDIVFFKDACVCESCKKGMIERGLNPENRADAQRYYIERRVEVIRELTEIVHSYNPNASVFYNSGGAEINRPDFHPYSTHYEIEDLPTASGGYDALPIRAKFFEKTGREFVGMTGKFHHNWGEFGGFKSKEAIKYEAADMMSVGASMSFGDHLHPSGKIDQSTYAEIGYAYNYIDSIKEYGENTKPYADLALWLGANDDANYGASKLLHVMHLEYDVVTKGDELSAFKCVILPNGLRFTESDKKALVDFANNGGKIIASYDSIFEELGIEKIEPSPYDQDYIECAIDENVTPFLAFSSAYKVKPTGEVLASVYEPYFSRTFRHFCGHKNTPFKTEKAEYPALIKKGNLIYFAHPVFEAYNNSGNFLLEKFVIKGFDLVYDRSIVVENLPSCGKVRLRKSNEGNFFALHTLYSPPIKRGNVFLLADFPTLHNVRFTVKVDKKIKKIFTAPDGKKIKFKQKNDVVTFTLPPFSLHSLVIFKW